MKIENVGFIGLGAMGSAMSPLIVQADYNVFGYDIASKIDKSTGVNQVDLIEDLKNMDVIIFMLPNSKIVDQVTNQLLDINIKSILIDMSSSDPRETKKLGETLQNANIKFLDAPVSGGVSRAKTGNLMIMAGGELDHVKSVQNLLSVMGKVEYAGPLG